MKYRKKPVVIDAVQWTGLNAEDMNCFAGIDINSMIPNKPFTIKTLEGEHIASVGDWIIKGVNGEFYPCKPDIFDKTYEAVA